MDEPDGTIGSRLWRRRRWLVALGVLLLMRAVLPEVLRRVMMSQAGQTLHAVVEIGDVDLALYRGGIALKDVTVRAAAPVDDSGAAPPLIQWKRLGIEVRWLPLLRKTVRLRQVALDSPRVALERLADGQFNLLALVPTPAQPPPAAAATPPAPAPRRPWQFGLDRVILRNGDLRFRDLTITDSEPIEIDLEHVEVSDIALDQSVYGGPSSFHLAVVFDQGSLDVDARVTLGEHGRAIEAIVNAWGLPMRQARLYIPKVGWSALDGTLDAALTYRTDGTRQNEVSGTVALRDVSVRVPELEDPALAWRNLTVRLDPLDLLAHRANVTEIALDGLSLLVRPQGGDLLPLLAAAVPNPTPAAASPAAAPQATAPNDTSQPWTWSVADLHLDDSRIRLLGRGAPLDVGIKFNAHDLTGESERPAHVDLALTAASGSVNVDGRVRLRSPGFAGTLRIADLSLPELIAAGSSLPTDLLQKAHLKSELTVEAGMAADGRALGARDVRVHGRLSLVEPRFTTAPAPRLSTGAQSVDIELTECTVAGLLPGGDTATAMGDVHVTGKVSLVQPTVAAAEEGGIAGSARSLELTFADVVAATRGDLRADVRLAVTEARYAAPGPQGFSFDARSLELGLGQLSAQGLLAASPDVRVGNGRLALTELNLVGADAKEFLIGVRSLEVPIKELTMPGGSDAATRAIRVALGDMRVGAPTVQVTRTPDGFVLPQFAPASTSASPPPPVPVAAARARVVEVLLDSLRLAGGQMTALDRTVKPFFRTAVSPLDLELHDLRWPALAAAKLRITAKGPGKIEAFGELKPDEGWFEVYGEDVALLPFNPYATAFSSYSVGKGSLSWITKGSFKSGRYDANTSLTLHKLSLQSGAGESLFQQQFGVPLQMALALLRDIHGDIDLDIPVQTDAQGTTVNVLSVIGSALRRAIVNALAAPLKLIGAVFGGDGTTIAPPAPIGFRPGRAVLDPSGSQQIGQLGDFLASRPGVAVTLETGVTNADTRWLREQALREEWENAGVIGTLRGLTQRSTRDRVRQALEARAKDEPAELSTEDATALDGWLEDVPAIPPERLQSLAVERLTATETALREGHGIDATRVSHREPAGDITEGAPAVRIELGSVEQ